MRAILLLGMGGFVGTVMRYYVQSLVTKAVSISFPLGTFIANVSGCFLIGLFYGLFLRLEPISSDWRLFFITGLCGGYTTFSSFSYESLELLQKGNYIIFFSYLLLSIVVGLLFTFLGVILTKL